MAVLVEGISVVFPFNLTKTKYTGGWEQFSKDFPEANYCGDGELIALHFKPAENTMEKVADYLEVLEQRGLTVMKGNRFIDVAIIDQLLDLPEGTVCDWLSIYTATTGIAEKPIEFDFSFGDKAESLDFSANTFRVPAPGTILDLDTMETIAESTEKQDPAEGETETAEDNSDTTLELAEEEAEEEESNFAVELTPEELAALPNVKACRLNDGVALGISLPKNWVFERSWTKIYGIQKPDEPFPQNQQ